MNPPLYRYFTKSFTNTKIWLEVQPTKCYSTKIRDLKETEIQACNLILAPSSSLVHKFNCGCAATRSKRNTYSHNTFQQKKSNCSYHPKLVKSNLRQSLLG